MSEGRNSIKEPNKYGCGDISSSPDLLASTGEFIFGVFVEIFASYQQHSDEQPLPLIRENYIHTLAIGVDVVVENILGIVNKGKFTPYMKSLSALLMRICIYNRVAQGDLVDLDITKIYTPRDAEVLKPFLAKPPQGKFTKMSTLAQTELEFFKDWPMNQEEKLLLDIVLPAKGISRLPCSQIQTLISIM